MNGNSFKRHFTGEAFLFSSFVKFNERWKSSKKSSARLSLHSWWAILRQRQCMCMWKIGTKPEKKSKKKPVEIMQGKAAKPISSSPSSIGYRSH